MKSTTRSGGPAAIGGWAATSPRDVLGLLGLKCERERSEGGEGTLLHITEAWSEPVVLCPTRPGTRSRPLPTRRPSSSDAPRGHGALGLRGAQIVYSQLRSEPLWGYALVMF